MILDSGDRTQFPTGAVRDLRIGKGRMDLCPLDIVAEYIRSDTLRFIDIYTHTGNRDSLWEAIKAFCLERGWDICTGIIEASKQYEEGCKKYGDFNWQKGIYLHCYVDSASRHYMKWLRGDIDEAHDRAVIWNLLSALWTDKHLPEMQDIATIIREASENNGEQKS